MKQEGRSGNALDATTSLAGEVADYLVLLLVALFAYELVARNLFGAPTGFADQLAAYALPAITFLAFARSLRPGGHVTVSVLTDRVGPRAKVLLGRLSLLLESLVCAAIALLSAHAVIEAYRDGVREFVGQVLVHEYLPLLVIPVGFLLAAIHCTQDLIRDIRQGVDGTGL